MTVQAICDTTRTEKHNSLSLLDRLKQKINSFLTLFLSTSYFYLANATDQAGMV